MRRLMPVKDVPTRGAGASTGQRRTRLTDERSQTVIRQGRDILHAWDATGTRRRRWITHYSRTEQVSLRRTGEIRRWSGNRTQPFSSKTLEETPASQAILPTLLKQEHTSASFSPACQTGQPRH